MSQSAIDVQQMQAQIAKYGSITQFKVRVQKIQGPAGESGKQGFINAATGGTVSSADGKNYNATWELGNWGDTMRFTKR